MHTHTRFLGNKILKAAALLAALLLIMAAGWAVYHRSTIWSLMSLKKIDDTPFYVMRYYGDYGFDEYLEKYAGNQRIKPVISYDRRAEEECSGFAVLNDNESMLYGRNLDISGNHPAMLLYTDPENGYSSVSMVELSVLGILPDMQLSGNDLTERWVNGKMLSKAPYVPRDGMNEKGVAVATLNAPRDDPSTPAGEGAVGRWQINRLILDFAASVDEAVALLDKYDIYLDSGVHYFVADAEGKSAVIEFSKGERIITENKEPWQPVTNFMVHDPAQKGTGQDRYDIMDDVLTGYKGRMSESEAIYLLKKVAAPSTCWSVIYNLTESRVHVVMGRRFDKVYRFDARQ